MFEIDKIMSHCRGIFILNQYMLLVCSTPENALQVFDKHTGGFIKSMLTFGRNTDEVLSPFITLSARGQSLYVLHVNAQVKLLCFNVRDSIELKPAIVRDYSSPLIGSAEIIPLPGNKYMANQQGHITIIDSAGKQIYLYKEYPEFLETSDTAHIKNFFGPVLGSEIISMKPDMTKLVRRTTYGYVSMLELFNFSDTLSKYKELRFSKPVYEVTAEYTFPTHRTVFIGIKDENIHGIKDMVTDDNYIYLLFDQGLIRDTGNHSGLQLWCLDWEGNPVRKYDIKDFYLRRIALDRQMNRMYFVRENEIGEEEFGYFELI